MPTRFTQVGHLASLAALALVFGFAGQASASTFKTLFQFGGSGSCGSVPLAGLVSDSKGNVYGTTTEGGANGHGTIFRLQRPSSANPTWTCSALHSFSSSTDGYESEAALIIDKNNNLYGTTYLGGPNGGGTAFKYTSTGFQVLYPFCEAQGCTDGANPVANLTYAGAPAPYDGSSTLYGTTKNGGTANVEGGGDGTLYSLSLNQGNWTEAVLHSFAGGNDGVYPYSTVVLDGLGNFYGATEGGGSQGAGVIFELEPGGTLLNLYSFQRSPDGDSPQANIFLQPGSSIWGTTYDGGNGYPGSGVIFEVNCLTSCSETVEYRFCSQPNCTDGRLPSTGLALVADGSGNLWATTSSGGAYGYGTVYEYNGTIAAEYNFTGADDGGYPEGGLLLASDGNLYGTTTSGGPHGNYGTVFEVMP